MHVPPVVRRWTTRAALAIVVAAVIGYVPGHVMRRDPRAAKIEAQLAELDVEAQELTARNTELVREIEALRTDVGAIEDRARADLGMVYPDEIVLRVAAPSGTQVTP
jgi:cell division protein FtsB